MPLSEDEVNELAKRLDNIEIDPEIEIGWTRNELEQVRKLEKSHVLAFRLHKRLRNDDQMRASEKAIVELRQMIKYFEDRLAELADSG